MTIEQFKQMFIALINWGWNGEYAAELTAQANNDKICALIHERVKKWTDRWCVSEHDALISLIERGSFRCKKYGIN